MIKEATEMSNIFGESEFKPLIRYQTEIPHNFISEDGRVFNSKNNKLRSPHKVWNHRSTGDRRLKSLCVTITIPGGLFPDYSFRRRHKNNKNEMLNVDLHRAVMETWRPIDEYPPIPTEDWDKCPESANQWIRDTAIVDHKDDDPSNNHVNNLQWVIPKDNNPYRKASKND